MSLSRKLLVGVALTSLLLGGCTSKMTEKEQYSGFLPNYSDLKEATSPSGSPVMRWVAPDFKPNAYDTVVFKGLELYPAPKPNERVNMQTLQQLQAYMTSSAKGVLEQKYRVVPTMKDVRAGSRALVMRAAITGVSASNQGMKWYEVVPVAAVVGSVSAATGHRDQDTELYIEAQFIDAASGKPVAKVVRKVFGKTLENTSQQVTANDFKAAIKELTSDLQAFIK
ncbi:DUF3313 domain-containing protein [Pseudomonas sp. H11T01]|uniref:DUF3313 domain-containing protein n=1 Tax=Pseudomonas sp. H11T01 TaxID=3402749 RepID=UPI003ACAD477